MIEFENQMCNYVHRIVIFILFLDDDVKWMGFRRIWTQCVHAYRTWNISVPAPSSDSLYWRDWAVRSWSSSSSSARPLLPLLPSGLLVPASLSSSLRRDLSSPSFVSSFLSHRSTCLNSCSQLFLGWHTADSCFIS